MGSPPPVGSNRVPVGPPGVMISPLLLQAQITAPAGGGGMGLADTTTLENPFQAPMWIDEIRFRLPGGTSGQAWSSIYVELKLGNINLTAGNVPISLLGKGLNDSNLFGETNNNNNPCVFTWKLPKPLFIPARSLLRPTIYFLPYSGAPTKVVTIIYACRPLPRETPTPRNLQIPWVTHYRPASLTCPGAVDSTSQSTPHHLYNPWDQELNVQRFVGRLMPQDAGEDQPYMALASAQIDLNTGLPLVGTFVSAQDSMNNILIRDATPFAHVFDFIDRAWTVNCKLPPKGFYLFTIDQLWSAYTAAVTASVGIGMVGWREVAYY